VVIRAWTIAEWEIRGRVRCEWVIRVTTVEPDVVEPAAEGPVLDGRYRLERRLGSGGMGSVWQARDLLLGRRVAVKLVSDAGGGVGGGVGGTDERLRREARAVGALAHPGVARLYDFCDTAEHTYLVMELAEGESLAVQLAGGRIAPERAVDIAAQCAEALDAAHRAWVVHRDVKPSNIMLTPRGVKLVDFGIASTAGDGALTAVGRVLGTAAYLAPERATGRPATPATDLYALGVVLYQMLAGDLPFRADDAISMMYAHTVAEPFPLPTGVPPALAAICHRLLAKDPAARPRSGATVARMLRDASLDAAAEPASVPTPAAPPSLRRRPRLRARRTRVPARLRTRRAAALALGVAAVLVVFVLSGWLAHGGTAPPPGRVQHSLPATQPQSGK
jgi:eukaryotic-like serine/threonine-protein kinase